MIHYPDLPSAFRALVPEYRSQSYKNLVFKVDIWEMSYGRTIAQINPKRFENRVKAYIIPEEMDRVRAKLSSGKKDVSIRFGYEKKGKGYHGERGDFCLIGGALEGKNLHLFYRSLELIGGLGYDVALIDAIACELGFHSWKSVTFYAARANVFALKRNSNEKLYPKLRRILEI